MKNIYYLMFTSLLSLSAACGDDIDPIERDWVTDNGEEDIPHSIVIKDESEPMIHPGGLHSAEDLARVKAKVASGTSPWIDGWNKLFTNDHFAASSSPVSVADESTHPDVAVTPNPTVKIVRGGNTIWESDGDNYTNASNQAHAAYHYSLAWKITNNVKYAQASINILNAWATTCKSINGDSNMSLAAGLYGYQFANAGELMRDYSGWTSDEFKAFQQWMIDVFYVANHDFIVRHHGTHTLNYWANWPLCNLASMLSIGILSDRRDIYNEAVEHLLNGDSNGCLKKTIVHVFDGENASLAQIQESGRDQGHATLVIGLLGMIAQMTYNQGDDFYGYNNNVILKAAEYVAKYNVAMLDVPFVQYNGYNVVHTEISADARGTSRPMHEVLYWHYARVKNLEPQWMKYTLMGVNQMRPEWGAQSKDGGGAYDLLGCGTLMYPRD